MGFIGDGFLDRRKENHAQTGMRALIGSPWTIRGKGASFPESMPTRLPAKRERAPREPSR
jgi:hypothetical protein